MSQEATTPDLVELTRRFIDAGNRRDLDAVMSIYAADVVWESLDGLGVFNGATAVRGFFADWLSSYEVFHIEPQEIVELGGGIVFAVGRQSGRLLQAAGRIEQFSAWALVWRHGLVAHIVASVDVEKVRAAAERLVAESS